MPLSHWKLASVVLGSLTLINACEAFAFQRVAPLSDSIHTRPIHSPKDWTQRGFTSQGAINQAPADFGPSIGMSSRTPNGAPASGDRFPVMQPGPLPGGFSASGFNSSGMIPPVNQPSHIANNPAFGGAGSTFNNQGAAPSGMTAQQLNALSQQPNPYGQQPNFYGQQPTNPSQQFGPSGQPFPPGGPQFDPSSSFQGSTAQMNGPFGYGQPSPMNPNGMGPSPQSGPRGSWGSAASRPNGDPRFAVTNARGSSAAGPGPYGSGVPASRKPRMQTTANSGRPVIVGLLGQFARPGTYDIGTQPMSLAQLVQQIGGMGRDSSDQLRVIRNGRPGQIVSLGGASQFELQPGDLVISEDVSQANRIPSLGDSGPLDVNSTNATPPADPAASGVQIGFVNLLDRPVVLKLRNEHANVATILGLMQQDSSLSARIQVLLPSSRRFQGRVHPNMPLPSETVLIFPANSVIADRLAGLPAPTKLEELTQSETTDPSQTNPAPSNPEASESSTPDLQLPGDAAATEAPEPPAEPSPTTAGNSPYRGRGLPNPAVGASHEAMSEGDLNLVPPLPQDAAEPTRINTPGEQRPINVAKHDQTSDLSDLDLGENAAQESVSWWNAAPIVMIGFSLSALMGVSLWLRRRTIAQQFVKPASQSHHRHSSRHAKPQQSSAGFQQPTESTAQRFSEPPVPVAASKQQLLESLIRNQVPLSTESVSLPQEMQFHGRPKTAQLTRIDAGHDLPKPHVSRVASPAGNRPIQEPLEFIEHSTKATSRGSSVGSSTDRAERPLVSASAPDHRSPLERALSHVRSREERS